MSPILGLDRIPADDIIFHAGTKLSDKQLVTNGGRVIAIVSVEKSLKTAAQKATESAACVNYEGVYFRKDIAHKAIKM